MNTNTISQLLSNWIDFVHKIVPEQNPYFNITDGISDSDINMYAKLEDDIFIPDALIAFYKTHNVIKNSIASTFSFTPQGGVWYQLIPFKWIKEEWDGIQSLYFGDALEEGNLEKFDPKVKADDYANPRWIPFADGDNGDYLLFDTDPSELGTYGQIIELQNETWERVVIANSIEELIESQIEKVKKREPKDFWDFMLKNDQKTSDLLPNSELKNLLVTVKYSTIKDRMPEDSWTRKEFEKNPENDPDILYYNGDLKIDYIDLAQPLIEYEHRNEDYELYLREQSSIMIFIDGDLFVNNLFSSNDDGAFGLVVTGSINAKNMIVGGGEIHVMEDLNVKDLLWGNYNHGDLFVDLEIFARVIIFSEEYHFDEEKSSYTSEYYFNENSEDYEDDTEYYIEAAESLFEPEHLYYSIENVTDEEMEDIVFWSNIVNRDSIIESLKENKNVLKTVFDGHEPYFEKSPLEKIKATLKVLVPICIKDSDKKNRVYDRISSLDIDAEILENPQEVLDAVCEHLDTECPNLFITIDHKFSVDDVAFNLEKTLKENFDLQDFSLPKETDYKGIPYVLKDIWIDFELALKAIDSRLQLTFLETNTDSYFIVLHHELDKWTVESIFDTLGFESYFHEMEFLEEHNHKNVPILFENKQLTLENYNRFFENYKEIYYDEVNIVLPLSRANVFVNKPHKRASDGAEVSQSLFFLLEDGAEVYVWIAPKKMLQKLFSKSDNFEILYKNINANCYQYKAIHEVPEALESFKPIWAEFLIHAERSQYYWKQLIQIATPERVRNILNLYVVKDKYNDFEDSDKMPWLEDYCLAFDSTADNYVIIRIGEEIEEQPVFDMRYFYFDVYHNNDLRIRYWSSQNNATNDIYTKCTTIQFLDYQLIKKATVFFTEGERLIIKDNAKYIATSKEAYWEYYEGHPVNNNESAPLTIDNLRTITRFCSIQNRDYNYDYFIIIEDYHWISVKWIDKSNPNNTKKTTKLIIVDEPFGNDINNENYASLKYTIEITGNNEIVLYNEYGESIDDEVVRYFLFHLIKDVHKSAAYLVFPNELQAIQGLFSDLIEKNQIKVFDSHFVQFKIENSGFWKSGIWNNDYFFSFQVWQEKYLDVRISWTHPEKRQLANLSNNMQVLTIRFDKNSKVTSYFFQHTFENNAETVDNFEFDLDLIEKAYIGYQLMLFKVKEESKTLKKLFEKKEKKKNIVFHKPYETVTIQGQTFKVIDRKEAEMYLKQCTDFEANEIYDPFYMFSTDGDEDILKKGFFLLAETEMELESLYLDTAIDVIDSDELYILGYIFKEKITIKKHLSAYDLDFSPPIICLADADIFSLYLSGNTHYFHQNLDAEFLHGHYNHGDLYVKGKATVGLIYADDFKMNFNKIVCWALVCDQYDVTAFDNVLNEKNEEIAVRNTYLATHNLEEVLYDRFVYEDEYGFKIKDHGYLRENQYGEAEETFVEFIENGGSPIDYDKLNAINESVEVDFKSRLEKIMQHPEIKSMNTDGILYKGEVENQFYFMKRDGFFQIGKWFLRQHIVVYITHFYEGETWLNVNYFEEDNHTNKYTFETKLADGYITSLIAKRIFREAEKKIL